MTVDTTTTYGVATSTSVLYPSQLSGPGDEVLQRADARAGYWKPRNAAFDRYDDLLALIDESADTSLESMVSNSAKTLFSLAHFMVSSSPPQRTISVGTQGPRERARAGKAERAVAAWWQAADASRLWNGEESWQYSMAYWMCRYGWYATLALTVEDNGEPQFLAVPYNPMECYPEFGTPESGLRTFTRIYNTTLGAAMEKAKKFGTYQSTKFSGDELLSVTMYDLWERKGDEVLNTIVLKSIHDVITIKPLEVVRGLKRIPILTGPVGGVPDRGHKDWMIQLGSVLNENEEVYRDFNKWLSFLTQIVREHAQAPYLAKNIHVEEEDIRPSDIRSGGAIVETQDPEAELSRVNVGPAPLDVFRLLGLVSSMEQRGGFPESAYGSLMIQLSGFGISQLLQAAERRVGAQVNKLRFIDAHISKKWLEDFRDNEFETVTIEGYERNNPRKAFVEEFKPTDVPQRFGLSTSIPVRIGNDLISRMSIVRQAVGNEQILDIYTALDEILQMEDPSNIIDRMTEDQTRKLTQPLRMVVSIRMEAQQLRASGKPGAEEVAKALEQFADTLLMQQQQAQGAQPSQRLSPEVMPPESRGVSPDAVRAAMRMGPPPNLTAAEQR